MKLSHLLRSALLCTMLALPLSAYEGWMTDVTAARAKAAAEGKQLVLEFTGSTWCPPCKALHAEVLTSAEFAAYAADKVLALVDYPRAKDRTPEKIAADPELARLIALKDEYKVPGFPTMFVFDAKGQELAKVVGYEKGSGPAAYLAELTKQ
ncbi:MAG: thioredoxin family protein [Candidatus Didemnitutus sp.]|nr:thioredoxin family protein [Candidatus Didemnitutus sp.]